MPDGEDKAEKIASHLFYTSNDLKRCHLLSRAGDLYLNIQKLEKLIQYDWPGNVRELENVIERGTILSHGPIFQIPDFALNYKENVDMPDVLDMTLQELEKHHIKCILEKTGWKIHGAGGAAELLDINPSTLYSRIKKLGIRRVGSYKELVK